MALATAEAQTCYLFTPPKPAEKQMSAGEIFANSDVASLRDYFARALHSEEGQLGTVWLRFYLNKDTGEVYASRWSMGRDGYPHYEVKPALVQKLGWRGDAIVGGQIIFSVMESIDGGLPQVETIVVQGLASINPNSKGIVLDNKMGNTIIDPAETVAGMMGRAIDRLADLADFSRANATLTFKWSASEGPKTRVFRIQDLVSVGQN